METWRIAASSFALLAVLATPSVSGASDAVEELVNELVERGVIDEATGTKILVKNAATPAKPADVASEGFELLKGLQWSGDLRLRNEHFWYDGSFGGTREDRNRFRYRARLGFTKQVNAWAKVGLRLASGIDHNSSNVSFGDSANFTDPDFGNDPISIDLAYAEFQLPDSHGVSKRLAVGKIKNPFVWRNGRDFVIWDNDITPEGIALRLAGSPREGVRLFANAGYFLIDEMSDGSKNPKVLGLQVGGSTGLGEALELGARSSLYHFRGLDAATIARNTGGTGPTTAGNLAAAFDRQKAKVGELSAYLRSEASDRCPWLLYLTGVRNFSAGDDGGLGREDTAFGGGVEVGSPGAIAKLGLAYFRVEANATPARFTDSDLFDAHTNREGFVAYGARSLGPNVDLRLTFFDGEEIVDTPSASFGANGTSADRKRLQADVLLKF